MPCVDIKPLYGPEHSFTLQSYDRRTDGVLKVMSVDILTVVCYGIY